VKLQGLGLYNFRCFERLEMSFRPKLTVLVAENGNGKTAVLDAIALGLGRLLTKLPEVSGIALKNSDIRLYKSNKSESLTSFYFNSILETGQSITWGSSKWRDSSSFRGGIQDLILFGTKEIDQYADSLIDAQNNGQPYVLPVVVYYGTKRVFVEEVKRRRNFRLEFARFNSLYGALEAKTSFRNTLEWWNALEEKERRLKIERRDFNHHLPELEVVRQAIAGIMPDHIRNPRYQSETPSGFVVDVSNPDGSFYTAQVAQLSDGYRTMLSLVMDLALRMAQANPMDSSPTQTNPLHQPAIVLIDEIELHLHPRWQQRVLLDLQRTFPNAQFIVSTHSPQVLTTVKSENIRILQQTPNGVIEVIEPSHEIYAQESRVALEDILVTDSRPPLPVNEKLEKYLKLVERGRDEEAEALNLREELLKELGKNDPALELAQILIHRNQARRQKNGGTA
jgi:predicted ATP-binding protein involved in virulence